VSPQMKSIDHVHVSVADRTAAESWYEKVLGLTRAKELEFWAPGGGPLTIQNRDGTVHLALFEGATEMRPSTVAFGVSGKEFIRWQAHLGEVLATQLQAEDHTVSWSLYFGDPDGNRFEITSYEYEAIERGLAKRDA
jgi:catechol 2,3-dioxygenase-like lactoylglutathione lyase family enzyme